MHLSQRSSYSWRERKCLRSRVQINAPLRNARYPRNEASAVASPCHVVIRTIGSKRYSTVPIEVKYQKVVLCLLAAGAQKLRIRFVTNTTKCFQIIATSIPRSRDLDPRCRKTLGVPADVFAFARLQGPVRLWHLLLTPCKALHPQWRIRSSTSSPGRALLVSTNLTNVSWMLLYAEAKSGGGLCVFRQFVYVRSPHSAVGLVNSASGMMPYRSPSLGVACPGQHQAFASDAFAAPNISTSTGMSVNEEDRVSY